MGFLPAGSPCSAPRGSALRAVAGLSHGGPRIHDQASRSHLGPLEPVLLSQLVTKARTARVGLEQRTLEMAPAVTRLVQRHAGLMAREAAHRLERRQRSRQTRRAHLQQVAPGYGLIHVETI